MSFFSRLRKDIRVVFERDPAARSVIEVLFCYSGLHAIWFHRISHALYKRGWVLIPRMISNLARFLTGIEILQHAIQQAHGSPPEPAQAACTLGIPVRQTNVPQFRLGTPFPEYREQRLVRQHVNQPRRSAAGAIQGTQGRR